MAKILRNINYVSVWDDYGEVQTTCDVNTETREVFNIKSVDVDVDDSVLTREYIVIDGKEYDVFYGNNDDVSDEYWDEENEVWTYYWYR